MYPPVYNISNSCEENLKGDEEALKALVAKRPVVIGFALTMNFMYYKSGIYVDSTCTKSLDHAMVIWRLFDDC